MRTRVAVVADSPMFRAGLELMLGADPNVDVVGAAAEPIDGAPRSLALPADADVVVWVPHDPAAAADAFDDDAGAPALVVLADMPGRGDAARALRAGVAAVLPLAADAEAVLAAVHAAAAGLVAMPRALLEALAADAAPAASLGTARAPAAGSAPLTPREREVLALLAQGLANKAIAPRLGITEHTVKAHVASIYDKLGAGNRAEVVMAAARAGLLLV